MNRERFHRSQVYAEQLRDKATPAERELCRLLDQRMISYVFQSNMCDSATGRVYIADFRIRRMRLTRPKTMPRKEWAKQQVTTSKLFVEVAGGYHIARQSYDAARTRWMEAHRGAVVLRFTNEDIFARPEEVLAKIETYGPARKTARISWTSPNYDTKAKRMHRAITLNKAKEEKR